LYLFFLITLNIANTNDVFSFAFVYVAVSAFKVLQLFICYQLVLKNSCGGQYSNFNKIKQLWLWFFRIYVKTNRSL